MIEEWRDIVGYEGIYQISNFGRVKSLERDVQYIKNTGTVFKKHYFERILSPNKSTPGYLTVMLYKDNKKGGPKQSKRHQIHILVGKAFIPNPDNLPQINHKDENKHNNVVTNLEWCTRKYNCNYGTRNERCKQKQKAYYERKRQSNAVNLLQVAVDDINKRRKKE